jgi:GntR family transcriptional regulator
MTPRIPRHRALAEDLVTAIGDGTYAVGTRLPTEGELAAIHGMARETVRRALDHVQSLGLIDRRPGAGTTVVAARAIDQYRPVAQSAADVVALAESTRLLHPVSRDVILDAALARRLGTRPGTTWHLLEGARVVKGHSEPICFSEHYLRGDLDPDRMFHGSGPDLSYAEHYRVEQTVSAALLTEDLARALHSETGAPALVIARRVRDRSGRLLNVGVHTHPADRFQITTVLEPGEGPGGSGR